LAQLGDVAEVVEVVVAVDGDAAFNLRGRARLYDSILILVARLI
jgi:hypothetical protein